MLIVRNSEKFPTSFVRGVKPKVSCMTTAYKQLATRKGLQGGTYSVYQITLDCHSGIKQGYIGVTPLTMYGVFYRYMIEAYLASLGKAPHRSVYDYLWQYNGSVIVKCLQWGMIEQEAYDLEKTLRPEDNPNKQDGYNWNMKAGGKNVKDKSK
jgi:hypothetical protein